MGGYDATLSLCHKALSPPDSRLAKGREQDDEQCTANASGHATKEASDRLEYLSSLRKAAGYARNGISGTSFCSAVSGSTTSARPPHLPYQLARGAAVTPWAKMLKSTVIMVTV